MELRFKPVAANSKQVLVKRATRKEEGASSTSLLLKTKTHTAFNAPL